MKANGKCCDCSAVCGYVIAVVGAFLIVAALVWMMHHYTQPAPLGEDRVKFRRDTLAQVRQADADVLGNTNYVWQDQGKGLVRLPVSAAMDLYYHLWQNPAAARSNLNERLKKAYPPPVSYE